MTVNQADVVIIGSGAGGGACAWALSRYGIKTLVLEAGPAYDPESDYRLEQNDWEQTTFPDKNKNKLRYSFGPMQDLDPQYKDLRSWNHIHGLINNSDKRIGWKYSHVQGVGGSTLHFTGEAHRLNPQSMNMFSRFGVAADWPVSYEELEPYYVQAENAIGVAGPDNDLRCPRSAPYPLPVHDVSYANNKIISGNEDMGWVANSLAILSRPYDDRPGCNYCNGCNRGCPRTDKGSVDVTFIRKAVASGYCTVKSKTRVIAINAGPNDLIQSVDILDGNGHSQSIKARIIITACGAVETPRLLLLSGNSYAPHGVANESGHVGKHLMETVSWASSGLHEQQLASYRGLPSDIICWDYNSPDAIPGVTGGCRFSPATAENNLIGPVNYAKRVVKGWGKEHKDMMRKVFGNVLSIASIGESLPNEKSFVDIDKNNTDQFGRPVARINSYVSEQEIRRLRFMRKMTRKILMAAGVETFFEEHGSYDFFNTTHIFGTARMGMDPQTSVVNKDCRSHRWKNLYIVDASIFPSSGGGESPSLTIEALAIRSAACIRTALAQRDI